MDDYFDFFVNDEENNNDKDDDQSNAGFVCENCGATDSYEDSSGKLSCANCFTQSQTMAYSQETPMDHDDMAKMANVKRGGLIRQKTGVSGPRKKTGRKPLEELDNSKPLPDLIVCIKGFQAVLKAATKLVGKILKLEDEELEAVKDSVANIWSGYVIAWRDGAEKYGKLYPDLRFSMRDLFLKAPSLRVRLSRVLSHKVAKAVRQEFEDPTKKEELRLKEETDSDSDDSSIEGRSGETTKTQYERRVPGSKADKLKRPRNVYQLANHLNINDKGREEAAITLRPSMNLAAAIIWLAISHVGITPGQMVDWIANGSLPFLNAFDLLLPSEHQQNLQALRSSFCMASPPTADSIEELASKLAIACGIKSTAELPQFSDTEDDKEAGEPRVVERLRFVSVDCVPKMIAQLVVNLGFGQRALDIAMALIGQPRRASTASESELPPQLQSADRWLPHSLQKAQPRKINSPEHVLAIIVVACKMCPGWESWTYPLKAPVAGKKADNGGDQGAIDGQESRELSRQRFIPWNEEQFKLLKDDQQVSDYLDFFEDTMIHDDDATDINQPFPAFSFLLEKGCKQKKRRREQEMSKPSNASQISNSTGTTATQSAGQGTVDLPPYLSYPNKTSHNKHTPYQERSTLTAEPFHAHYSRLVEYISYKTHVTAYRIHAIVADLDEEVVALCEKKKFKNKKTKRKRRRHSGRGQESPESVEQEKLHKASRKQVFAVI